ncbi:MAG: MoaD/ThiS family protein [Phycisphaeraceae bacterium]
MADTITIHIPTALRPQTGNQESVSVQGGSIREALGALTSQYPDLGKRLFKNPDGSEINRFINVYVNDEDIRFLENQDTKLKTGDEVSIVPAIAGG